MSQRPRAASPSPARASSPTTRISNRGWRAGFSGRSVTAGIETKMISTCWCATSTGRGTSPSTARCASTSPPRARRCRASSSRRSRSRTPSATASAMREESGLRWTRGAPTSACMRISATAKRPSTWTPRARRCSSADGGAMPMPRRCARISRRDCWRSPAGRRAPRSSIRCAAAARSPSRLRRLPRIARRGFRERSDSRGSPGSTGRRGNASDSARTTACARRRAGNPYSRATSTGMRSSNAGPTRPRRASLPGSASSPPTCWMPVRRRPRDCWSPIRPMACASTTRRSSTRSIRNSATR